MDTRDAEVRFPATTRVSYPDGDGGDANGLDPPTVLSSRIVKSRGSKRYFTLFIGTAFLLAATMSLLTRNSIVSTCSLGILKVEVEDDRKGLDTTSIEASQCLDFAEGGDLDRLIQKSAAVYFVAAPKA